MTRPALVQDGQPGNGIKQRWHDRGQVCVEDPRSLRATKDKQMRRGAGGGGPSVKNLGPHGDARDLGSCGTIAHAAGKFTAAACTRLPTSRLAKPGIALGSKARVGIFICSAAAIPGPEA